MTDSPEACQTAGNLKGDIREWWAGSPMTYGDVHGNSTYHHPDGTVEVVKLGSRRFFDLADETFYRWNLPHHVSGRPFAALFDYERYRQRPVLEVGCGMGCMAMNWAKYGAKITALDLNPVSIEQTRARFAIFELKGDIREADAEALPFGDRQFAFAYSWGVLHHTPGTRRAIAEIYRVLEPGGRFGVMLYNRKSLLYRFLVRFQEGWVNMEQRFLSETQLASRYGDGERAEGNPHTWPVTPDEVRRDLFASFANVTVEVFGTDVPNVLNVWAPALGSQRMPQPLVRALARRWGWSLWITGEKPS
jgi:ubiquinone/menaquinone biosynthesis C-methylase UbiE